MKKLLHAGVLSLLVAVPLHGAPPPTPVTPTPRVPSVITIPATNAPRPGAVSTTLRDVKPLEEIPNGWMWLGRIALVLGLVALGWWAWSRWRKRSEQKGLAPAIPPAVTARERLREALALIDQPQPFCFAITETLRTYLESQFGLRATEQTTEEFLDSLHESLALDRKHKGVLEEFLTRCDLVKFAKVEPARAELEELHQSALRLVEETENFRPPQLMMSNPVAASASPGASVVDAVVMDAGVESGDARYMPRETVGKSRSPSGSEVGR